MPHLYSFLGGETPNVEEGLYGEVVASGVMTWIDEWRGETSRSVVKTRVESALTLFIGCREVKSFTNGEWFNLAATGVMGEVFVKRAILGPQTNTP